MLRIFVLLLVIALPAAAQSVSGFADVTDGDTLQVGGVKVRLAGIDAPERHQLCGTSACGIAATQTLVALIGNDTVTCVLNGGRTYDRIAGTCSTPQVADLGRAMVMSGYAMDEPRYPPDYTFETQQAAQSGHGMWVDPAQPAWVWRAAQTSSTTTPRDSDCAIKGNISANGRIYHVPGSRNYDRTSINASERWFCSVAEAEAAGWRAPR